MNVLFNLAYFYVNYKLLYRRHVPFFSMTRIFCFFVLSQVLQEQLIVKQVHMHQYRVNINDLFDQDEDFLYDNEHFRALVKKVKTDFDHLVNPIFDLEDAVRDVSPQTEAKFRVPAQGYVPMDGHELIYLYANTFNAPSYSRLVYDKMMEKYDKFF